MTLTHSIQSGNISCYSKRHRHCPSSRQSRKIRRFNLLCDDTPPKDEAILCTGEELSSPVYLLSLLPQRLSYHWAPLRLTAPCPAFYTSALTLKEDRRKAVPLVYILRSEQNGHSTA